MQGIENTPVFNTCIQKIDLFFSEGKIFTTQVRLLEYITSYHHITIWQLLSITLGLSSKVSGRAFLLLSNESFHQTCGIFFSKAVNKLAPFEVYDITLQPLSLSNF